jgi:glycerol-3-phosphate cytidylyltransferase-like family protein
MSGRTLVFAENPAFARDLAISLYGNKNLISVVVSEDTNESQTTNKPIDPDQQRIKALSNQKQQISQQLKNARAQNKLKKAQQAMQSVRSTKPIKSM